VIPQGVEKLFLKNIFLMWRMIHLLVEAEDTCYYWFTSCFWSFWSLSIFRDL